MNKGVFLSIIALFCFCITGCSGRNGGAINPPLPGAPKIVEEYLDASMVALTASFVGSNTWNYAVKVWGGVNQTITTEALVAESNPEQVSIYVKRVTDNSAEQIILLAQELISSGSFTAGDKASVSVVKKK